MEYLNIITLMSIYRCRVLKLFIGVCEVPVRQEQRISKRFFNMS